MVILAGTRQHGPGGYRVGCGSVFARNPAFSIIIEGVLGWFFSYVIKLITEVLYFVQLVTGKWGENKQAAERGERR